MKILLALDLSPHSRRAAEYVAAVAPHIPGCQAILFSVLRGISYGEKEPAAAGQPEVHGDEDHSIEMDQIGELFREISALLQTQGLPENRIQFTMKPMCRGIAQDIIDEASVAEADTIVVGRRGLSRIRELIEGSVSRDLVQKSGSRALWIVE